MTETMARFKGTPRAPGFNVVRLMVVCAIAGALLVHGRVAVSQDTGFVFSRADLPDSFVQDALRRVRELPASALDRRLPGVVFPEWLFMTTAPFMDRPWEGSKWWHVSRCDDRHFPIPEGDSTMCVDAGVRVNAERSVHVVIAAAEPVGALDTLEWREVEPVVRDIYLERLQAADRGAVDTLDVHSLAELADALRLPAERWPVADLIASITASEAFPLPGRSVRFDIDVTNKGTRSSRAAVRVKLQREGGDELWRDWFEDVGAGQSIHLTFTATLPAGRGIAVASVEPARSSKVVRRPRRDPAVAVVGGLPPPGQ
jgi:hypothetical protein